MKDSGDSQLGFHKSAALASRFTVLSETGSTNDDAALAARDADDPAPDFSVVVTTNQTRGRGRLGRAWVATSGKMLASSVLLRPTALSSPDALAWLPLLAGVAMARAIADELARHPAEAGIEYSLAQPSVGLKWPNDVQIDGYKVCGILTELLPDVGAVVVGAGLNLTLDEHDLPTLTSTSLRLVTGVTPDADEVLAGYLAQLRELTDRFHACGGDAEASGGQEAVRALCTTLGQSVRVELPADRELLGRAEDIGPRGELMVRDAEGTLHQIAAGDVTHLRLNP